MSNGDNSLCRSQQWAVVHATGFGLAWPSPWCQPYPPTNPHAWQTPSTSGPTVGFPPQSLVLYSTATGGPSFTPHFAPQAPSTLNSPQHSLSLVVGEATLLTARIAFKYPPVFTAESNDHPSSSSFRPVDHLMIDLKWPKNGPLGTIVIAAAPDQEATERFFSETITASDLEKLKQGNVSRIQASVSISFYSTGHSEHPFSRWVLPASTVHLTALAVPGSNATAAPTPPGASSAGPSSRASLPLTDDQVRVAAHVAHDELMELDITRYLVSEVQNLGELPRKKKGPPSGTSLLERTECFNRGFRAALMSNKGGDAFAKILTDKISDAIRRTARGELSPKQWED